jgi:hemerythrin HHE cation binding domain-containing protein
MTQQGTTHRSRNTYWTLMHAQHDAFRRDLDDPLATDRRSVRARWTLFRDQLHFHHTAENTAMWPPVRAKLTGDPVGLALMDAMEEEHKLIDPLLAATDDTPPPLARRSRVLVRACVHPGRRLLAGTPREGKAPGPVMTGPG